MAENLSVRDFTLQFWANEKLDVTFDLGSRGIATLDNLVNSVYDRIK